MGKFTSGTSGATGEEMKVVRVSVQGYPKPFCLLEKRTCLKLKLEKREDGRELSGACPERSDEGTDGERK